MKYFIFALIGALGYGAAVAADVEPIRQISEEQLPGVVRAIDSTENAISLITSDSVQRISEDTDEADKTYLGFRQISTDGTCFFRNNSFQHASILSGNTIKDPISVIGVPRGEAETKLDRDFPSVEWVCAIDASQLEKHISPTREAA